MSDLTPITREEALLDGQDLTPITRQEKFIRRIFDKTQEIPEPITREEKFLKKAGDGEDVVIESLSVTENGTYSEEGKAYSPVNVDVHDITTESLSVTANGTYTAPSGKAYTPVNVNVPLPSNAYLLKTVSGLPASIASFTASDAPLDSLKVGVEAVQDLHGQSAPYPAGGGKNKLPLTVADIKASNTSGTWSGNVYSIGTSTFTIQVDSDGNVVAIKGKNTSSTSNVLNLDFTLKAGSYILSSGFNEVFGTNDTLLVKDNVTIARGNSTSPGQSFTLEEDSTISWRFRITNDEKICTPMIRLSSVLDTTFAPYSNICPISGWDEAKIWVQDVVDTTANPTVTIQFGQTVYGGELDVVNGGGNVTHQFETISGGITRTDSSGYLFVVKDLNVPDITDYDTVTPYIISNYLTPYSVNDLRANAVFGFTQYNKRFYIRLGDEITTVADANAYLASNNLQIKYELATPTTISLTPLAIRSLLGSNNIFADCGDINEVKCFEKEVI